MFVTPQARSKKAVKGWQLVGRGEPSDAAPTNDNRTVRPLRYEEIERMSADEAAWHMRNNLHWKAAFEEEERRRTSKRHVAKTRIELAWSGHSTPQEDEAAIRAGQSFASRTPSFPRTLEAATLMCEYMKRENLDAGIVESYSKAFNALVEAGKITPLPYESADQFLANHGELLLEAVPPLIASQQAKAAATAAHFEQAASSTAASGSTKVVDYAPEQRGPLYANTNKTSFRNLLKNLSADKYLEKMQDPQFRAAVDKLEEK